VTLYYLILEEYKVVSVEAKVTENMLTLNATPLQIKTLVGVMKLDTTTLQLSVWDKFSKEWRIVE
jgi:hypothetical protein